MKEEATAEQFSLRMFIACATFVACLLITYSCGTERRMCLYEFGPHYKDGQSAAAACLEALK